MNTVLLVMALMTANIYNADGQQLGKVVVDSEGIATTYDMEGNIVAKGTTENPNGPPQCPFKPECFEVPQY